MSILNTKQSRQLTRSQSAENFLVKNEDKYAILKPFSKAVADLSANNKEINALVPARSQNGKSATAEKKNLKAAIATGVGDICSLVIPYAIDIEEATLFSSVNFTATHVIHMRDANLFGFVTTLVGVITPLLSRENFSGYPVTAADLDTLMIDAGNYNENLGAAKVSKVKSSIASANIDALMKANRLIIRKLNKLINFFKKKDPGFAEAYYAATALSHTGAHHSGIRGTIINTASEQPAKEVSVTLEREKSKKTTTAGSNGTYAILKCRAGTWNLIITAPGYQSQTIVVTVIRGKIIELNITLQSQILDLNTA